MDVALKIIELKIVREKDLQGFVSVLEKGVTFISEYLPFELYAFYTVT